MKAKGRKLQQQGGVSVKGQDELSSDAVMWFVMSSIDQFTSAQIECAYV